MSTNSANLANSLSDKHSSDLIQASFDPHRYDDIINLERPILKQHPPLSPASHAAQFAPFAALTGYHETIQNTENQSKDELRIEYFADESSDNLDI